MSIVESTIAALREKGLTAEWHHTGGGCYAIRVPFLRGQEQCEVLITDREDVFAREDHDSDSEVFGFWSAAYGGEGDPIGEEDDGAVYYSASHVLSEDADARVAAVRAEIPALVEAVAEFITPKRRLSGFKVTVQRIDRGQVLEKTASVMVPEGALEALLSASEVGLEGGPEGEEYDAAWELKVDLQAVLEGEL